MPRFRPSDFAAVPGLAAMHARLAAILCLPPIAVTAVYTRMPADPGGQATALAALLLACLCFAHVERQRLRSGDRALARARHRLAVARLVPIDDRLHPHFVYNTLSAVAALAWRGDRQSLVCTLARLRSVLRLILMQPRTADVSLGRELAVVRAYVEIQRMRLGERLRVAYDIQPAARRARVPLLVLQTLVENAVRHGVMHCGGGLVRVGARYRHGILVLRVQNECADAPRTLGDGGFGIGLSSTRQRLQMIYGGAATLRLTLRARGPRTPATATATVRIRPYHRRQTEDTRLLPAGRRAAPALVRFPPLTGIVACVLWEGARMVAVTGVPEAAGTTPLAPALVRLLSMYGALLCVAYALLFRARAARAEVERRLVGAELGALHRAAAPRAFEVERVLSALRTIERMALRGQQRAATDAIASLGEHLRCLLSRAPGPGEPMADSA